MYNCNVIQKFSVRSLLLLSLILIISVPMFGARIISSMTYSFSNSPTQSFFQLAYAQDGAVISESESESDGSSESDNPDFSSPPPARTDFASSTTTDPSFASSPITTVQSTIQNPVTLTDTDNTSSSLPNDNNGEQELDCNDISVWIS